MATRTSAATTGDQNPVQTFCTSLKRPEAGRSRRRLGARPSLSWRTRRPRRQPVGWRAGADRAANTTGSRGGVGELAGRRPGRRPGRRGPGDRAGPLGEPLPSSVGFGGAQCAGALLRVQGRASRRKRRPCGLPLTSEPLRPSGRSRRQADGLPSQGCAPPTPTPTRRQLRSTASRKD